MAGNLIVVIVIVAVAALFLLVAVKALRKARDRNYERLEGPKPPAHPADKEPTPADEEDVEPDAAVATAPAESKQEGPARGSQAEKDLAQETERMRAGLRKTTQTGFIARLNSLFFGSRGLSRELQEEMETLLLSADIGVRTVEGLLRAMQAELPAGAGSDGVQMRRFMRTYVEKLLLPSTNVPTTLRQPPELPAVYLFVGVNGVGKTTTIGKLAGALTAQGKRVLLAAGDTFRAAAVEQLEVWARRSKADILKAPEGSDPTSVIFDAVKKAQAEGYDCVLADTAGRLHTKVNLMDELRKTQRVVAKARAGAPDEVLLVLDANTGQNAIMQAREFNEALGLTGLILTKLDGTAKGGVVIGINAELKIPVRYVGIGEGIDDLRPFNAQAYVAALFDETAASS
jgi:fused signal recognition particle receptor